MFNQTNYLVAKQLLDTSVLRHQALASNLANAETAGYKRVDVSTDFEAQLRAAVNTGDKGRIKKLEARLMTDPTAEAVRNNGNNVELDTELMLISENALNYEFLTQYLTGNFNKMRSAISGRVD